MRTSMKMTLVLVTILSLFGSTFMISAASDEPITRDSGEDAVEPQTWVKIDSGNEPGVKICGLMVYDSGSDVVILFGGYDGSRMSGETWAYDYKTNLWSNMTPDPSPPGRCGPGLIYDQGRDIVILFGGLGNAKAYCNDTWKYDYDSNTWTELKPTVSPSPRCKGGTTYDVESDQMVWFGGYGPDEVLLDETWTYNFGDNTWINRTSDVRPPARQRNPLMYDEESDVTVMFCGWLGGTDVLDDLWVYDFNTNKWTEMSNDGAPHKRCRYGRFYDPGRDVIVYTHGFGGDDGDLNDTWSYDYDENTWTRIDMLNDPPEARHCFQTAYIIEHDVAIMQGGASATGGFDGSWLVKPFAGPAEEEEGFPVWAKVLIFVAFIVILLVIVIVIRNR